jgi:5-methylthioribose kinase
VSRPDHVGCSADGDAAQDTVRAVVERCGLLRPDEKARITSLAGGVSSDIWKIQTADRSFVVKRALPALKVAAQWRADPRRSRREVDYLRWLAEVAPGWGPRVIADDPEQCLVAMEWLAPDVFPLWKTELLAGRIDVGCAGMVGDRLACLHRLSSADPSLAERFGDLQVFCDLRLESYFFETGRRHVDLARAFESIAESLMAHRYALVHGDISPKNILVGPAGPVFLDAEVATWCDPAFDLAFCLNHLALKALRFPVHAEALLASFRSMAQRYLAGVSWEAPSALEARGARLLPALMLARVDGKSPVEYLGTEPEKERVRALSRSLIVNPAGCFEDIAKTLRAGATEY